MTHKRMIIAVEASSEKEAEALVFERLYGYLPKIFDYFTIGGRWDGDLDGKNVCSYKKNPNLFNSALEHVNKLQQKWLQIHLLHYAEIEVPMEDRENLPMDKAKLEKRIKNARQYFPLSIPTCREDSLSFKESMRWFHLDKAFKLSDGDLCTDSYFYDLHYGHSLTYSALNRIKDKEIANKQYLVLIDAHH